MHRKTKNTIKGIKFPLAGFDHQCAAENSPAASAVGDLEEGLKILANDTKISSHLGCKDDVEQQQRI